MQSTKTGASSRRTTARRRSWGWSRKSAPARNTAPPLLLTGRGTLSACGPPPPAAAALWRLRLRAFSSLSSPAASTPIRIPLSASQRASQRCDRRWEVDAAFPLAPGVPGTSSLILFLGGFLLRLLHCRMHLLSQHITRGQPGPIALGAFCDRGAAFIFPQGSRCTDFLTTSRSSPPLSVRGLSATRSAGGQRQVGGGTSEPLRHRARDELCEAQSRVRGVLHGQQENLQVREPAALFGCRLPSALHFCRRLVGPRMIAALRVPQGRLTTSPRVVPPSPADAGVFSSSSDAGGGGGD